MADIIQVRRDTAANWTSADPTLANGEYGYETDTKFMKIGDGSTVWTSLAYFSSGALYNIIEDITPQLGGNLDLNGKSLTEELVAGENLIDGDLCYLKSDGKFYKTDANVESTSSTMLAIAIETINIDATGTFLIFGKYITSGMTAGLQYVSTLTGVWTNVAPSGSGDIVRVIGTAVNATVLYFNPSSTFIKI